MQLQLINKKISNKTWLGIGLLALFADIIDYLVLGAIPVYGDILDIIVMAVLTRYIGLIALGGAIELVPVAGDFVPTYVIIVVLAWLAHGSKRALH